MPKGPVDRTTKSRRRRHQGLASALTALVVAATAGPWAEQSRPTGAQHLPSDVSFGDAILDPDGAAVVVAGRAVFARQSPPILRPDYTGNVQLEIVYGGSVEHVRVFRSSGAPPVYSFDEFPRVQTATIAGQAVSIFRPSWSMSEFIVRFRVAIDFESGVGATLDIAPATVPLLPNGFPTVRDWLIIRAMSVTVGNVPVVQIDATAQYSSHIVNLVVPALAAQSFDYQARAAQLFYSYFGDDYEQLAFVFREHHFAGDGSGASHNPLQSTITGINLPPRNFSGDYGSAGRLEGIDTYLGTLDNDTSNHELSHQWGHYFDWERIIGIRGFGIHSPVWGHLESQLTNGSIISSNQQLRRLGGLEWEVVQAPEPTQMPPLQLYAMGLLPASAVPPMDIFENQNQPRLRTGDRLSGATRRATIDQVIAIHGPRVGPTITSVRRATILLSRDALATPEEMAYWTLQAQRLEDPYQTGMISERGIGSFRSVSGVPLYTSIIPPGGGPPLSGHTVLEPDVLDPRDLAGVVLDTAPRLDVPHVGIFRMQGRIVDPQLAGATSIGVQHGAGPTLSSNIAPDGSFSINGSPEMAVGRFFQRTFVVIGGFQRTIALVRNVRLFQGPRVPPPPVALTATASGGNVSIQWSPDTGWPPSSYFVDVGSSPGASNLGTFPTTATMLSASGVPDGQYYIRVRAANSAGVSAPSLEAVLSVGCAPPLPPGMLTGVVNGSSVAISWQPSPTSGVSYTIVAGSTSGASNIAQVPVGVATSLSAPVPPGRYFARVRAVTACGTADSNEIELVVGSSQVPGPPLGFTHQVSAGTVSFSWQAPAGVVDGYVLEAGSQPGLTNLATLPVGNSTSLSVPGVPPGAYYVRVRAFNAAGQGPPSSEATVIVP